MVVPLRPEDKNAKSIQNLAPIEDTILSWVFQKKSEVFSRVGSATLKLIVIYTKNNKISSLTKKMDVLLI